MDRNEFKMVDDALSAGFTLNHVSFSVPSVIVEYLTLHVMIKVNDKNNNDHVVKFLHFRYEQEKQRTRISGCRAFTFDIFGRTSGLQSRNILLQQKLKLLNFMN